MVGNLKEFLTYLEEKNIINPRQLENEAEVSNLINDILKLDLNKFKALVPKDSKSRASGTLSS